MFDHGGEARTSTVDANGLRENLSISRGTTRHSTGDHVGDDATRFDSPALALVAGRGEPISIVMCLKADAATSTCVEMTFVRLSWGSYS